MTVFSRRNTLTFARILSITKSTMGCRMGLSWTFDAPILSIHRTDGSKNSTGPGDTDMGIKWNFRKYVRPLSAPDPLG